jgi:hypothetical protein
MQFEEEKGDLEQSRWIAVMLDPLDEWEKLVVTVCLHLSGTRPARIRHSWIKITVLHRHEPIPCGSTLHRGEELKQNP